MLCRVCASGLSTLTLLRDAFRLADQHSGNLAAAAPVEAAGEYKQELQSSDLEKPSPGVMVSV